MHLTAFSRREWTTDAMAPVDKPKHAGKAIVAGGISGALEVHPRPRIHRAGASPLRLTGAVRPSPRQICCTFPLEYVKTVSQLSTSGGGALDVVKNTMRTSGPLGFYRGLSSMVYFATPKAAIRFSAFEVPPRAAARSYFCAPHASPSLACQWRLPRRSITPSRPRPCLVSKLYHPKRSESPGARAHT